MTRATFVIDVDLDIDQADKDRGELTLAIDWETSAVYFWAPGIVQRMDYHTDVISPTDYLRWEDA
jgi:hypothetical protein